MTAAQFSRFNSDDPRNLKRRIISTGWTGFGFGVSSLTIPGHVLWRPIAITFTITNNATVATRFPRLQFNLGGGQSFSIESGASVAASLTGIITYWIEYGAATTVNNNTSAPMPTMILTGGEQIILAVANSQTGDTMTNQLMWADEVFAQEDAPPAERVSVVDRLDSIEESLHRLR